MTSKAVVDVISKTSEYLQPNPGENIMYLHECMETLMETLSFTCVSPPPPASRAKLSMLNTMSKIRGQVKNPGYPQAEGLLGECMSKYGRELGEDTNFGKLCVCVCVVV